LAEPKMGRTMHCFQLGLEKGLREMWLEVTYGGYGLANHPCQLFNCGRSSPCCGPFESPLDAAATYVELANQHDHAGLFALLADPCDLFGEPASGEAVESYFGKHRDLHVQITKPFKLASDDPYTVEFEYVKTWREGKVSMKMEAGEFVTFTSGAPRVVRIGYTRPPSEPAVVMSTLQH